MKQFLRITTAVLLALLLSSCVIITEQTDDGTIYDSTSQDTSDVQDSSPIYKTILTVKNSSETAVTFDIDGTNWNIVPGATIYFTDSLLTSSSYSYSSTIAQPTYLGSDLEIELGSGLEGALYFFSGKTNTVTFYSSEHSTIHDTKVTYSVWAVVQ